MKLWPRIHQFKFVQIKSKTELLLKQNKLELLTLETMKLLGSTKKDKDKDKNGKLYQN